MKYIMLLVNAIYIVLFFKSRKIICLGQKKDTVSQIFYRMSIFLLSFPFFQRFMSEQLSNRLTILYPTIDKKVIEKHYYGQKLSLILLIILVGTNLLFIKEISDEKNSILQNGYFLQRGEYGEEETEVDLDISEDEDTLQITYPVLAKKYTDKEIQNQMKSFEINIEAHIIGENTSLDEVKYPLVLKEKYDSYAFCVEWESEQYTLVDSDGNVQNESLETPQIVLLTAVLSYDAQTEEIQVPVCVYPKDQTPEDIRRKQILEALQKADNEQKAENQLRLPQEIDKSEVTYQLSHQTNYGVYMLALIFISVVLYYAKDRDLDQKMKQREQELNLSYSEFVSQFVLLVGAGMSIRGVLEQLSKEKTLGRYLIQELKILVRDLANGVLETEAIDAFGKRCGSSCYIKLSGLLVQNMKKGNSELLKQLQLEAQEAFMKRKNDARKLGEEAGTKLLLPMMGMLLVVMMVIILPAFLSFQL